MKIDNTVKFIFTSSLLLKRWHHYSCAHLWVMSSLTYAADRELPGNDKTVDF